MNRRGLFLGAAAFLAAPSIVRASSLMPVKVPARSAMAWYVGPKPISPFTMKPDAASEWIAANKGLSWANPFASVADAMRACQSGDSVYVSNIHIEGPIVIDKPNISLTINACHMGAGKLIEWRLPAVMPPLSPGLRALIV